MLNIEDKIEEMKALEEKFKRAAPPQPEDLRKLCATLGEVLRWVAAHDDGRMLSQKLGELSRKMPRPESAGPEPAA